MRICFVAGTLGRGGAERQLVYMLRALRNEGHASRVVCLTEGEAFEKEIRDLGIEIEWIGRSPSRLVRLKELIQSLKQEPADLLQSSHFYTNCYVAAAGRFVRVPSIGAIRNDLKSEIDSNGVFGRWQLSLPGSHIANSKIAIERAGARGYPSRNLYFVRNVVETAKNDSQRERSKTRLLFAGRLVKQKRPECFIELASRLCKLMPSENLEFTIVGGGPLLPQLEELAAENGLQNKIEFQGEQDEMTSVYQRADVLISTSEHEGTPNVVLEAMAHGKPVVATRVGGVPEIVGEGCGFLVNKDDHNGMVDAVRTLILDASLRRRMGNAGREYVKKNHSIEYLQKRLTGIYTRVLDKGNANGKNGTASG